MGALAELVLAVAIAVSGCALTALRVPRVSHPRILAARIALNARITLRGCYRAIVLVGIPMTPMVNGLSLPRIDVLTGCVPRVADIFARVPSVAMVIDLVAGTLGKLVFAITIAVPAASGLTGCVGVAVIDVRVELVGATQQVITVGRRFLVCGVLVLCFLRETLGVDLALLGLCGATMSLSLGGLGVRGSLRGGGFPLAHLQISLLSLRTQLLGFLALHLGRVLPCRHRCNDDDQQDYDR